MNDPLKQPDPSPPVWLQVFPFLASGVFFVSVFFTIFAPLPLMWLSVEKRVRHFGLAVFSNALIVGLLSWDLFSVFFYLNLVVLPAFLVVHFLEIRKWPPDGAIGATVILMVLASVSLGLGYSAVVGKSPFVLYEDIATQAASSAYQTMSEMNGSSGELSAEEIKKNLLIQAPYGFFFFCVLLVWANTLFLLRANPGGLRKRLGIGERYFYEWKLPDTLIWPTLLAAGVYVYTTYALPESLLSHIAYNVMQICMVLYLIQGFAILAFLFEHWGVRGITRTIIFVFLIFFAQPLITGVGFVNLWFDFRKKFGQT